MDPMTMMATASMLDAGVQGMGMMKKPPVSAQLTQGPVKLGVKPQMIVNNPYQNQVNPNMMRNRMYPYNLSSTLGRYGGLV